MNTTNASAKDSCYNEFRRWLWDLAEGYMIDLDRPGRDVIDLLANAITHQLHGRSAGRSHIERVLAPVFGVTRENLLDAVLMDDDESQIQYPVIEDTEGVLEGLTPSQRSVAIEVVNWLQTGKVNGIPTRQAILRGYAGMGKTYVAGAITRLALKSGMFDRSEVILTAPSHQARKVIRNTFYYHWNLALDTCTFAGLLGLTPDIDEETGEEIYIQKGEITPRISDKFLVIADEASQWGRQLQSHLDGNINGATILWLGDDAQLPPVEGRKRDRPGSPLLFDLSSFADDNDSTSPIFNLPGWELKEVVRYSGAIAQLANDIRKNLDCPRMPIAEIQEYAKQDDTVVLLSRQDWESELLQSFKRAQNPDQVRALSWRNKRVQEINRVVHEFLHGESAAPYCRGESLVALSPCKSREKIVRIRQGKEIESMVEVTILQNGEQALIKSACKVVTEEGLVAWQLNCTKTPDDDGRTDITLLVIDESCQAELNRRLSNLARQAKAESKENKGKSKFQKWGPYFELRNRFHRVSLAYALTVHKAQGSTFEEVYVDLDDIGQNKDKDKVKDRNRMIYTAITRCSRRAVLTYNQ
jgi:exodeoxyribonuclease-5